MQVTDHLTQCTLPAVGFVVLLTGEPAQQISRAVVEFVVDEMVADTGFAGVRVNRTFTIESQRHDDVAESVAVLPHFGIATPIISSG